MIKKFRRWLRRMFSANLCQHCEHELTGNGCPIYWVPPREVGPCLKYK